MQGVIVVAGWAGGSKLNGLRIPKSSKNRAIANQDRITVLLHAQRLPFDDGRHRSPHPGLLPHNAVDLLRLTVTDR